MNEATINFIEVHLNTFQDEEQRQNVLPSLTELSSKIGIELFLDAVNLIFLKMIRTSSDPDTLSKNLVEALLSITSEDLLLLKMDEKLLYRAGLVDQAAFPKRRLRLSTKLFLEQQKSQLFAESPQGWALMIEALLADYRGSNPSEIIRNIIGRYGLDGNMISEIAFSVGSLGLITEGVICVMLEADPSRIEQICMRKLAKKEFQKEREFLQFLAVLVQKKILCLEKVWTSLNPKPDDFYNDFKKRSDIALELFKLTLSVRLARTKEEQKSNDEHIKNLELNFPKTHLTSKLSFFESLITCGMYSEFFTITSSQREFIDYRVYQPLIEAIFKDLFRFVETNDIENQLIKSLSKPEQQTLDNGGFVGESSKQPLTNTLNEMFDLYFPLIKYHLALSPRVFKLICNSSAHWMNIGQLDKAMPIFQCLIASLFSVKFNIEMADILFGIISNLRPQTRYELYEQTMLKNMFSNPYALKFAQVTATKLKIRMRKLNFFGSKSEKTSMVLNQSPFVASKLAIKSLKAFSNHIRPFLKAVKFAPMLVIEIFQFVLIHELNNEPSKIQPSMEFSPDFNSLAQSAGDLFNVYPKLNKIPILSFVIKKITSEELSDFCNYVILQKAFELTTGVTPLNELTRQGKKSVTCGELFSNVTMFSEKVLSNSKRKVRPLLNLLFEPLENNLNRFVVIAVSIFKLRKLVEAKSGSIPALFRIINNLTDLLNLMFSSLGQVKCMKTDSSETDFTKSFEYISWLAKQLLRVSNLSGNNILSILRALSQFQTPFTYDQMVEISLTLSPKLYNSAMDDLLKKEANVNKEEFVKLSTILGLLNWNNLGFKGKKYPKLIEAKKKELFELDIPQPPKKPETKIEIEHDESGSIKSDFSGLQFQGLESSESVNQDMEKQRISKKVQKRKEVLTGLIAGLKQERNLLSDLCSGEPKKIVVTTLKKIFEEPHFTEYAEIYIKNRLTESVRDALFSKQLIIYAAVHKGDPFLYFDLGFKLIKWNLLDMGNQTDFEAIQLSNFMFFAFKMLEKSKEVGVVYGLNKCFSTAAEFLGVQPPSLDRAKLVEKVNNHFESLAKTVCSIFSQQNFSQIKNMIKFLSKVTNIFPLNKGDFTMIRDSIKEAKNRNDLPADVIDAIKRYRLLLKANFEDEEREENIPEILREEPEKKFSKDIDEENNLMKRDRPNNSNFRPRPREDTRPKRPMQNDFKRFRPN